MNKKITVGIIGAGQLARMLAIAAHNLGLYVIAIGSKDDCAAEVCPVRELNLSNKRSLLSFCDEVDIITFENENINTAYFKGIQDKKIAPSLKALEYTQDRLSEKLFLKNLNIPTTTFKTIDSFQDLQQGIEFLGVPSILKTRRFGYDGKGQQVIKSQTRLDKIWSESPKKDMILEGFVDF